MRKLTYVYILAYECVCLQEHIRLGAFIDATVNGETALHAAVRGKHADVLETLIQNGANVSTMYMHVFKAYIHTYIQTDICAF